jgi:8-oxo-dGTP diphosphatase
MPKPVKCAIAAVLRKKGNPLLFLAVKRPPTDDLLPNLWGLPAVSLQPGELPEAALRRLGREKLNTNLEPVRFIGIKAQEREDYQLILMDLEAELAGPEPSVQHATSEGTRYVDQVWTDNPDLLRPAAQRGSVCCQLFLEFLS